MLRPLSLFLLFIIGAKLAAQGPFRPDAVYKDRASRAFGFYQMGEYLKSGLSYDSLFNSYAGRGTKSDKYNAACSWALAENKNKAFFYLEKVAKEDKWDRLSHLMTDTDLRSLRSDSRWEGLIATVSNNKTLAERYLNKPLVTLLDSIYKTDQESRLKIDSIQKKYGMQSPEMASLFKEMGRHDSINRRIVTKIIDSLGWPGPDVVGEQGASTIFLVIQHSDSLTQVTYVQRMREAVKNGKARTQDLALLEDRILTTQGRAQIYGSQLKWNEEAGKYEFFPIMDAANVNKRRNKVGLQPIEVYAKFFGIEYTAPAAKPAVTK